MHWPVPASTLRPLIPKGLDLDTFAGEAWLGIVPFLMRDVRPRFWPSLPGVWFFSLEAANPVAVRLARRAFKLPYFDARMQVEVGGGEVRFQSRRTHHRAAPASFKGRYRPRPDIPAVDPTLSHFLTERYRLYSADARGRLYRADIHHRPWPLERAEVELTTSPDEMTRQLGLRLPAAPPLSHYAERLSVRAGWPYRVK